MMNRTHQPIALALTLALLTGCGTLAQEPTPPGGSGGPEPTPSGCAGKPITTTTPAAPTGPYAPSASEAVYPHLLTGAARRPSTAGALKVITYNCMKTLADASGQPIQLRGMSTHGLQWFPGIVNDHTDKALANDWGANVIRLAMYVGEGGYATNPDVQKKVIEGIDDAIANDLYVIVDWHVISPGDPTAPTYSGAMDFFKGIAQKYPNDKHIIYEVANEPNPGNAPANSNDAAGWAQVKGYAEPIIKMLRDSGNQNLVIVGTPNWSQRPDLAAQNPINDPQTMYTVHFYTGTHKPSNDLTDRSNVMSNARYALEHGAPIFVTEWGTSEASGNNGPFLQEADTWLDFLNAHNVSWVNWSLSNKNETSAALRPFPNETSLDPGEDNVWAPSELTVSGEFVRSRIKGVAYQPTDRNAFTQVLWNFDDGAQGWGVNADSAVKSVTVSGVAGALQVEGLAGSSDVTAGNFWANARLSADGAGAQLDLTGATRLSVDVSVAAPTTVSIAAVPQSSAHGWANPTRAVVVGPEAFTAQPDGRYRATVTLTDEDAPNLKAIVQDSTPAGHTLTNLVLFVGAQNTDSVALDNIAVSGSRTPSTPPVEHAPLGAVTLPSTFEDGTRQGWHWAAESGVQGALTVADAGGSKALTWDITYPDVKPADSWASAPRLTLDTPDLTRGENTRLLFDLYLKPERSSKGSLSVNLSFGPPSLGYWAQAQDTVTVPLDTLSGMTKTADGLYRVQGSFDLTRILDNKVLAPDTALGRINLIVADVESDYAGTMFMDNVRLAPALP